MYRTFTSNVRYIAFSLRTNSPLTPLVSTLRLAVATLP